MDDVGAQRRTESPSPTRRTPLKDSDTSSDPPFCWGESPSKAGAARTEDSDFDRSAGPLRGGDMSVRPLLLELGEIARTARRTSFPNVAAGRGVKRATLRLAWRSPSKKRRFDMRRRPQAPRRPFTCSFRLCRPAARLVGNLRL